MKRILLLLLLLAGLAAYSRDIKTLSGTEYKNASIFDSNPYEIVISFINEKNWNVMKSIPFTDLPDDIRKEYKYDPAKAEEYEKGRMEWEKKIKAEKEAEKKGIEVEKKEEAALEKEREEANKKDIQARESQDNNIKKVEAADPFTVKVNDLFNNNLTEEARTEEWKKFKFKEVESSGIVLNVKKADFEDMFYDLTGDVCVHKDCSNAFEVDIKNNNLPKNVKVLLVVYNCDTAKRLTKGEPIKFRGVVWKLEDKKLYLNSVRIP